MDLADLLVSSTESTGSLLEQTRANWPLNQRAASVAYEAGVSDRVRLRRAMDIFAQANLTVSGIEHAHKTDQAQVTLFGGFNQHGNLKSPMLEVDLDSSDLTEQVQMVLQAAGFPAVISHQGNLMVFISRTDGRLDDQLTKWLELGFIFPVGTMSPERCEQWITTCPQLQGGNGRYISAAERTGLQPQQMKPWLEITSEPDQEGDFEYLLEKRPGLIEDWAASGLTPEEAQQWLRADNNYLREFPRVKNWIAAGWNAEQSGAWINLMRFGDDPARVNDFLKEGFTAAHAIRIERTGSSSWDVTRLRAVGCSAADTVAWLECNVAASNGLQEFRDLGINPRQLKRLNKAAIKGGRSKPLRPADLSSWAERDFKGAEEWLALHERFTDTDLVLEWEQAGMGVEQASSWAAAQVPSLAEVEAWRATHPSCSDPELVGQLADQGITPDQAALVLKTLV